MIKQPPHFGRSSVLGLSMLRKSLHENADQNAIRLFAVVVHIGRGPNHGHYVAVVKSGGRWLLFDDDIVELVNEEVRISYYFNSTY